MVTATVVESSFIGEHLAPGGGEATGTGTIWNDDHTFSIDAPSVPEGLTGTTELEFTVTLDPPSHQAIEAGYSVTGGDATAGTDFAAVPSGSKITFEPGDTTATFSVTVNSDNVYEPDETVDVTVTNLTATATIPTATGTGTILNDDHRFVIDSPRVNEGEFGPTDLVFTVTIEPSVDRTVVVSWGVPDGSGTTEVGDLRPPFQGRINFEPGATKTVTVTINGDEEIEDDETVVVSLLNTTVGVPRIEATGEGTVLNDDHGLSIDSPIAKEGETGTTPLDFTVTLDPPSHQTIEIGYDVTGGTATAGTDFATVPADSKVEFAPGETTKTVSLTVNGDADFEPSETVEITLTNLTTSASIQPVTGTGTIQNDDHGFSIDSPTVTEGDSGTTDLTFTVTLDPPVPDQVTVDYATSDGEGRKAAEEGEQPNPGGEDYEPASGMLVFPANTATQTITVAVNGDGQYEFDEVMEVELSNPDGPEGSSFTISGPGIGTINNDDILTYTIRDDSVSVLEGSRSGPLSDPTDTQEFIRLYADLNQEVFLEGAAFCLLEDGTAKGSEIDEELNARDRLGIDYHREPQRQGFFERAGLENIGCRVTILSDDRIEPDETVNVYFYSPDLGFGTEDDPILMGTGTIVNDDHALTIDTPSVYEGDSGTTELEFTVTLDPQSTGTVTVDYVVGDGSATSGGAADEGGDDYEPASGTLTFEAGETEQKITVTVNGDETDEPDETVEVTLSDPEGPGAPEQQLERTRFNSRSTITVPEGPATGTITDDDGPPAVTLVLTPASIGENGGESTVTATLNRPSSAATMVRVSATPIGPATADDYTLNVNVGPTLTIAAGQTASTGRVTITAVDNDVQAADKEVTVSATASNTQGITAPQDVTLTITDDDAPSLSIADASVTEGDAGESATLTFTVTLSRAATQPATVDWATADGTARPPVRTTRPRTEP